MNQLKIDKHQEEFHADNDELVSAFRKFCKKYDKYIEGFMIEKNKNGYWSLIPMLDMDVLLPKQE